MRIRVTRCYFVCKRRFSSLIKSLPRVAIHAISKQTATTPITINCQYLVSCHTASPTAEPIIPRNIRYSIGIILCFCFLISLKNNTPETTSPPKHTMGTTSIAQPEDIKSSTNVSRIQEYTITFTTWLIRLYSTKSGQSTKSQIIHSPITTTELQAVPPKIMFARGQTKAAIIIGHFTMLKNFLL